MCGMKHFRTFMATLLCIIPAISFADADSGNAPEEHTVSTDLPVEAIPDLTEESTRFKFLKKIPKNLLLVPIPTSSPTFGTGLILGGAWFYSQTEEQKNAQPASFTGAAAGYTDNESWFAGVMQQNYWKEDTWRFTGVAGYLNLELELRPPDTGDEATRPVDWLVDGAIQIAEKIGVSEAVISVSMIAVGTSIPELAASVIAVVKKEKAISLGNLIGSNIFNIGSVLGITSMIKTIPVTDDQILSRDIFWMLLFAAVLLPMIFIPKRFQFGKLEGLMLVGAYGLFIFLVFLGATN